MATNPGIVYFLRIGSDGPIKIGFTRDDLETRARQLQIGCPWPLTLLGSLAGSVFHENWLHERFSASRMTGEWFQPSPALLAEIEQILSPGYLWPVTEPDAPTSGPAAGKFLADIEAFLAETGMSATAFGARAVRDPKFVHDLRSKGRQPSLRLVDRVNQFIASRDHVGSAA